MPIYEYECQDCGTVFEVIQKFSDPELTDCRFCDNERPVKKLISAAAFHLKGTGWYVTDFRDKSKKQSGEGSSSDSSSDSSSKSGGESNSSSDSQTKSDSSASSDSKSSSSSSDAKSGDSKSSSTSASAAAD